MLKRTPFCDPACAKVVVQTTVSGEMNSAFTPRTHSHVSMNYIIYIYIYIYKSIKKQNEGQKAKNSMHHSQTTLVVHASFRFDAVPCKNCEPQQPSAAKGLGSHAGCATLVVAHLNTSMSSAKPDASLQGVLRRVAPTKNPRFVTLSP